MQPFFIFALPRSGTAWLANFLTYGNVFCYHEATLNGFDRMRQKLDSGDFHFTGNSDSGNTFFYNRIRDVYPNRKTVIVIRDTKEVMKSMADNGYLNKGIETYEMLMDGLMGIRETSDKPMVVEYMDIFTEKCARSILDYITGGKGVFNVDRFNFLKNTNVQIDNSYALRIIEHFKNGGAE